MFYKGVRSILTITMETQDMHIAEKPTINMTFVYIPQYPHVSQMMYSGFLIIGLYGICERASGA